jgi:acylphosphatase
MTEPDVRLHALIEGRVQGVGFRYFVLEHANRLGLKGWVRNTYQGNVEVIAEGCRDDLNQFLDLLNQGPRGAFITQVIQEWGSATSEFDHFAVTRTI